MPIEDHCIETIIAFAEAIMFLRDPYEDGHEKRVSQLSKELAIELHLPAVEIEFLQYAARLHDVGKIMIAESVLNKPKLTASERKMVHSHAALGAESVSGLQIDDIHLIIRHHHENWDGSGYPDGLLGDDIPQSARILRIVDSFDAMTNTRPYRAIVYSEADALVEMEKERGTCFDPVIFDVFKNMVKVGHDNS